MISKKTIEGTCDYQTSLSIMYIGYFSNPHGYVPYHVWFRTNSYNIHRAKSITAQFNHLGPPGSVPNQARIRVQKYSHIFELIWHRPIPQHKLTFKRALEHVERSAYLRKTPLEKGHLTKLPSSSACSCATLRRQCW